MLWRSAENGSAVDGAKLRSVPLNSYRRNMAVKHARKITNTLEAARKQTVLRSTSGTASFPDYCQRLGLDEHTTKNNEARNHEATLERHLPIAVTVMWA